MDPHVFHLPWKVPSSMKILPLSVKGLNHVDPYHFSISFKDHKQTGPFLSSSNLVRVYDVDVWFNGLKFMEDVSDGSSPILELAIETDGTYHFPTSREPGDEPATTFIEESGRHFRTECKYIIDEWPPKSLKDQPTHDERSRMLKPIPFTTWKVTILNPRHTLDLTALEYVQFIFHVEQLRE
jgi:hypothetical protein